MRFNQPAQFSKTPTVADVCQSAQPLFRLEQEQPSMVMMETVKKAQAHDHIILRLYEAGGCHARAKMSSAIPVSKIQLVNMLGTLMGAGCETGDLELKDNSVALEFTPFEVKTLKVYLN
jgi:alpha-mannosidase